MYKSASVNYHESKVICIWKFAYPWKTLLKAGLSVKRLIRVKDWISSLKSLYAIFLYEPSLRISYISNIVYPSIVPQNCLNLSKLLIIFSWSFVLCTLSGRYMSFNDLNHKDIF